MVDTNKNNKASNSNRARIIGLNNSQKQPLRSAHWLPNTHRHLSDPVVIRSQTTAADFTPMCPCFAQHCPCGCPCLCCFTWSPSRREQCALGVLYARSYLIIYLLIIAMTLTLLIYDLAHGNIIHDLEDEPIWFVTIDISCVCLMVFDVSVQMQAHRATYWKSAMNVFDFVVVTLCVFTIPIYFYIPDSDFILTIVLLLRFAAQLLRIVMVYKHHENRSAYMQTTREDLIDFTGFEGHDDIESAQGRIDDESFHSRHRNLPGHHPHPHQQQQQSQHYQQTHRQNHQNHQNHRRQIIQNNSNTDLRIQTMSNSLNNNSNNSNSNVKRTQNQKITNISNIQHHMDMHFKQMETDPHNNSKNNSHHSLNSHTSNHSHSQHSNHYIDGLLAVDTDISDISSIVERAKQNSMTKHSLQNSMYGASASRRQSQQTNHNHEQGQGQGQGQEQHYTNNGSGHNGKHKTDHHNMSLGSQSESIESF